MLEPLKAAAGSNLLGGSAQAQLKLTRSGGFV
jgi:hypothetical protein